MKVMVFKFPDQEAGSKFLDFCITDMGCSAGWPAFDGMTQAVFRGTPDKAKEIAKAKEMGGIYRSKLGIKIKGGTGRSGYAKYRLKEAVQRLREATTSASVGAFMKGPAVRPRRKLKCKGRDTKCRDAEWEVQMPVGGIAMLRRT